MIQYIIDDLFSMLCYIPYGIIAWLIAVIFCRVINSTRVSKKKEPIHYLPGSLFFMYMVIVFIITFLSRETGSRNGVDLELFSTWGINARNNAFVVENVLLFIPFGFVCAWAIKAARSFWFCTLLGLFSSLGIECMQLATRRGYFQIDDIFTNVIGTVIGYILFRCVLSEERTRAQRTKTVYIVLAALMMMAMFMGVIAFSSESASESNELSMKVSAYVVRTVDDWLHLGMTGPECATVVDFMNPVLRKLAHTSEYAALAVVVGFGYQMIKRRRAKVVNYFYAVILCGFLAVADEMLQKYVFFRSGRALDIAIDICGAVAGGCVYVFLSELFEFLAGSEE